MSGEGVGERGQWRKAEFNEGEKNSDVGMRKRGRKKEKQNKTEGEEEEK